MKYINVNLVFLVMSDRWGKKYVDNRDWKQCNRKLVDRGAFFLDHSILDKWKTSVDRKNNGKYGRPFEFPDELIYWAALQHVVLGMPYRQIQGYLEQFFRGSNIKVPDYTTLFKRIRAMRFDIEVELKKRVVIAVDSSGFKVSNRGEWRRDRQGSNRRGWVKLHVAVDEKTKQVLSFKITGEHAHDSELFIPLLKQVDQRIGPGRIKKALGDRGFDSKPNFNYSEKRGDHPYNKAEG